MKRLILLPALAVLLATMPACNEGDESTNPATTDTPTAKLLSASDCKQFVTGTVAEALASTESCLEYDFDVQTRTLKLRHVNAGFNCCPGLLSVQLTVQENIITLIEREREAGCHCLCLFDLEMEISNLDPGSYRIVVIEPYLNDEDAPLSFAVDLEREPSGKSCVPRAHYPWGI